MQHLLDKTTQGDVIAIEEVETIEDIQQIVNTFMYDYNTG